MSSLQMTLMEHVWTPKFQHHYPRSNSGHLASEASELHLKRNFLSEWLHLGVRTSFLQDRVMGKVNADTANQALLLL